MMLLPALLALSAMQEAPVRPAPPPTVSAPSRIVSDEQFGAALAICRDQLAKPKLAGEELAAAGWPKAISVAANGKTPAMTSYRHPDNLMLVTLIDHADQPDQCTVMVPFGPELDPAKVIARVSTIAERGRDGPGGWPTWTSKSFDLRFRPMATAGVNIVFTEKAS